MIFQDPMTSLNPVYTIGNQLREPLKLHLKMNKTADSAETFARACSKLVGHSKSGREARQAVSV